MLRAAVLAGLALVGLVSATQPSQAYWVRRYYGPVFVHRYYRPYYYGPRVVVVPPPPVVVVRPRYYPYGYYP